MAPAIGRWIKKLAAKRKAAKSAKSARAVAEAGQAEVPDARPHSGGRTHSPVPAEMFDERTERNIATLLPAAQVAARRFMNAAVPAMAKHGVDVRIISGTRSYTEQDALYAKGRTTMGPKPTIKKPLGNIVTKAKGGYSNHNFGVAFDIALFRGAEYLTDSPFYAECGAIGKAQGLEWGGDWKSFPDRPHYELKTGLTLAQMRDRVASGAAIA